MFQQLSGSRNWTMSGATEIIYSEKLKWLDENNVTDPDCRDDFLTVVSKLDNAYINHIVKKSEKK